jgi:hypothetical protein
MKNQNLHQQLEDLARLHLRVMSLHKSKHSEVYTVSVQQIEKALRSAFLKGEKIGYKQGFSDAKQACNCSLDDIILPINIDKTEAMV